MHLPELNGGYTDPVATHPAYQRRGLHAPFCWLGYACSRRVTLTEAVLGNE